MFSSAQFTTFCIHPQGQNCAITELVRRVVQAALCSFAARLSLSVGRAALLSFTNSDAHSHHADCYFSAPRSCLGRPTIWFCPKRGGDMPCTEVDTQYLRCRRSRCRHRDRRMSDNNKENRSATGARASMPKNPKHELSFFPFLLQSFIVCLS